MHDWPPSLSPRIRALNDRPLADGAYVLVWIQQTLRATDNPLIDAGLHLANARGLPVLVYHGLRQDYPHASDRLHRFILGGSRDLQKGCAARGLACVTHVSRPGHAVRGLVYRLAASAACVLTDDQPVFVARAQADAVARRLDRAVIAVDTARLVPTATLPAGLVGTPAFRKAHTAARADHEAAPDDLAPACPPYAGPLPFEDDRLAEASDRALDALVAACAIDHSLPPCPEFPADAATARARLDRFVAQDLARYPWRRNNPADETGVSRLSPYLHFGVIGPREIARAVRASDVNSKARWKFFDELLTWREFFHYRAFHEPRIAEFDALAARPRESLLAHAGDSRPVLYDMATLTRGETGDETWNAAQRQWLVTGYMHNNLRMYWGKQIIKWTDHPARAWAVACHLNDRLSLDGRDPATYGNMAWVFGATKPGWREEPVYGWVAPKSDGALRKRDGFADWARHWAAAPVPDIAITEPARLPATDPV